MLGQMTGKRLQYWLPSRSCTERRNASEIEPLYIFTMGMRPTYHPIGSIRDPADPTARLEVCLVRPHRLMETPIIYLTKYCGQQVGERSVGLHPDIANDVARMLRAAAALSRGADDGTSTTLDGNEPRAEETAT
jgi:hypothetical protein